MTISAKVICDSIANGIRLTTLELYYPRFIHSQFLTHRQFSRNASSSRAVPVQKNIDAVIEDCAMPIHWGKNKHGMQADEELDVLIELDEESKQFFGVLKKYYSLEDFWKLSSLNAAGSAKIFQSVEVHKQIVNRILEPFSHIKVICTATEFQNFFDLRLHDDAQPEIKRLAECMKEAMDNSTPNELKAGEWHLPFVQDGEFGMSMFASKDDLNKTAIKCSVARVARISYNNHDGSDPVIHKDVKLHDDLVADFHMSPTEHQATPMDTDGIDIGALSEWVIGDRELPKGITHVDRSLNLWSGNLKGFLQYRQLIQNK